MRITIAEFIQTLNAHRLIDHAMPSLQLEGLYWAAWAFDNTGAHYIPPIERTSIGQFTKATETAANLIMDRAEERFYETGKWPLQ